MVFRSWSEVTAFGKVDDVVRARRRVLAQQFRSPINQFRRIQSTLLQIALIVESLL